jgi:uncharacterized protein YukE
MNTALLDKYKQMHQTLERVNNSIRTINDSNRKIYFFNSQKKNRIQFFLYLGSSILSTHTQFDEIEDTMSNLESTIKHLDAYSRSLESQVKKFEKIALATRSKSSKKD